MKRCSSCKQEKLFAEFGKSKCRADGLQTYCRACRKVYSDNWYKENSSIQKQRSKISRKKVVTETRQYIYDTFRNNSCVDCGESRVPCLQFDHLDASKKEFNVSSGTRLGIKKTSEEMDKCEIVCANCHAIRTAEKYNWYSTINKW